jgi:hypothetical protein
LVLVVIGFLFLVWILETGCGPKCPEWVCRALAYQAENESDYGHDHEHEEQDLGDLDGTGSNAAEAEDGGDKRNDEEHNGVVQHSDLRSGREARGVRPIPMFRE